MRYKNSSQGFTIVELLIVIVVIAILAAISIVAFTGIQARAENTKTTNAVASYAKALRAVATESGEYPGPAGGAWSCLPSERDYCGTSSSTPSPSCFWLNRTPTSNLTEQYVATVASSLPKVSQQEIPCDENRVVTGAFYRLEPGNKTASIAYFLRGDVQCDNVAGLNTSRQTLGDATRCFVYLPALT